MYYDILRLNERQKNQEQVTVRGSTLTASLTVKYPFFDDFPNLKLNWLVDDRDKEGPVRLPPLQRS